MCKMSLVRCKQGTDKVNLKENHLYWVDDASRSLKDGAEYVAVYADEDGQQYIGTVPCDCFKTVFRDLLYSGDSALGCYINNDEEGALLKDIVAFCERTASYYVDARAVKRYIDEKGIATAENLGKEYHIRHKSVKAFERPEEYKEYLGYSLCCRA